MNKIYCPKGSMCMSCKKDVHYCGHLNFKKMKVHEDNGKYVVVICSEYVKRV